MYDHQMDEPMASRISALERKVADLRHANENCRQMLENLNEVLYTLDKEGVVTFITRNVEQIGGYRPEEIIGRKFTEFVHPGDLRSRLHYFRNILKVFFPVGFAEFLCFFRDQV